ncbi:MAG: hypothetical protein NZ520_10250 [bacterium]|nr:hypothetical protein [bacterium]
MEPPLKREVSPTVVVIVILAVVALVAAVYWFTLGGGPKTEPMPRPPEGIGSLPPAPTAQPAAPTR